MSPPQARLGIRGMGLLRRGLGLVHRQDPLASTLQWVASAALATAAVAQVWLAKLVLDALAAGDARRALLLAVVYALTVIVPAAVEPVSEALAARLEERTVATVDRSLIDAGGRLVDLTRIEQPAFHDDTAHLLQRVGFDLPRLGGLVRRVVTTAVALIGVLGLLASLHPALPVAIGAALIPHLVAERRLHERVFAALSERARDAREAEYCLATLTMPQAAKEVRVFGLGGFFHARYRSHLETALAEVRRARLRGLATSTLASGAYAAALIAGFWYVASRTAGGTLTIGDIGLYLNALVQAQGRTLQVGFSTGYIYEILLLVRRYFAFLDQAVPGIRLASDPQARAGPERLAAGVELRGVRFGYPGGAEDVLADVTAVLPTGTVTALVGVNGAGKSTLVKLLTRMYDPDDGELLLDGHPLAGYDLQALRERISVVHQDFARFALSFADNIAVGLPRHRPDASGMHPRVRHAARLAGAEGIAARLACGYDTPLTRRFDGGVDLSGGEWQKVALARGFVRDAAVIILDEPSATLDAEAEHELFQRFRRLVAGRTALLITHRFSTVRMADRILVLHEGCIVEAGTHAELAARRGHYATMLALHASRYR